MTRIGLADLLDSDIEWGAVDFERRSILPTTTKERLRPHQKQALADVSAGLVTHTEDTSAHDLIDPAATDTAVLFKQMVLMAAHRSSPWSSPSPSPSRP